MRESGQSATISVRRAAELLGISPSTAWRSIRRGDFPVQALVIGGRTVIPSASLWRVLGWNDQVNKPDQKGQGGH